MSSLRRRCERLGRRELSRRTLGRYLHCREASCVGPCLRRRRPWGDLAEEQAPSSAEQSSTEESHSAGKESESAPDGTTETGQESSNGEDEGIRREAQTDQRKQSNEFRQSQTGIHCDQSFPNPSVLLDYLVPPAPTNKARAMPNSIVLGQGDVGLLLERHSRLSPPQDLSSRGNVHTEMSQKKTSTCHEMSQVL